MIITNRRPFYEKPRPKIPESSSSSSSSEVEIDMNYIVNNKPPTNVVRIYFKALVDAEDSEE